MHINTSNDQRIAPRDAPALEAARSAVRCMPLFGVHCYSKSEPARGHHAMVETAIGRPAAEGVHVPGAASYAAPRLVSLAVQPRTAVLRSAGVVTVPDIR